MSKELESRIRGSLIGNSIGDAFGGVVEFATAERLERITGSDWADEFLPYPKDFGTHPLGVWVPSPPRGTGTDDTRNNQIFVECVIRNGGFINSQFLAIEQIERYRDRERFYPGHEELAGKHFRGGYKHACAHLGMRETPSGQLAPGSAGARLSAGQLAPGSAGARLSAGKPSWVLRARGNGRPSLAGLISLAPAGLLYRGEPEKAYRKAFELAYWDLGYARDATSMMAAMTSAALGGGISGREMVEIGLETDPFGFGSHRIMAERVRKFIELAGAAPNDRALVDALSKEVRHLHPYDPIDVLGVPMAAIHYTDGDPVRSIVIAANDRDVDDGKLVRLRDVDCTAGVAGALVGALCGIEAFPEDWVRDTVRANREVYGIDLEANAKRFLEAVYPRHVG